MAPASLCARSSRTVAPSSGATRLQRRTVVVHASEGLMKKPELKRPVQQAEPPKLFSEAPAAPQTSASAPAPSVAETASTSGSSKFVSLEFQRQRAKEMRKYFQDKQMDVQIQNAKVFGWTPANEISNGRWVMFGFAVGLLTEYATGVDFIEQLKLMVNYLGISDLD